MKLKATLLGAGKTAAGIQVPDAFVSSLSDSRRPKVKVTVKGHTYRSSIANMGGKFMLGVSNAIRDLTGVKVGDTVEFSIELDTEERVVDVPADFLKALKADKKAHAFFEALAFSHKSRHVLAIEGAKTEETRQRRIAKAISMLHEGKK